jgi:regulatory protein
VVEETLTKAQEAGLLDDRAFAKMWIEDRLAHHPLSRRAVTRELADKGIPWELVSRAMSEGYPPEMERKVLLELAQARWARYTGLDPVVRMRRTVSFLTRSGFSVSDAAGVVRAIENGRTEQASE